MHAASETCTAAKQCKMTHETSHMSQQQCLSALERHDMQADLGVSQTGSVAAMATTTRASWAHPNSAPASSTLPIQGSTGNPARALPTRDVSLPTATDHKSITGNHTAQCLRKEAYKHCTLMTSHQTSHGAQAVMLQ